MSIQVVFSSLLVFLLVWVRFAGMILFNPLFSRVNVPVLVRFGIVMLFTLLVAPTQDVSAIAGMRDLTYVLAMFRELGVGLVYGFAFQIFYSLLFYAGELMDTDFGISMAKTFDPATSIQVGFSGSLLTIWFVTYFFISNSHLALFRMYAESFVFIPLGAATLSVDVTTFILRLFVSVFMLALRVIAPFMVAEFILQASMGILMKFIPQITVFVINFQLRIILGMLLLLFFAPYIGQFIDNYITVMFDNLSDLTVVMAGGP